MTICVAYLGDTYVWMFDFAFNIDIISLAGDIINARVCFFNWCTGQCFCGKMNTERLSIQSCHSITQIDLQDWLTKYNRY